MQFSQKQLEWDGDAYHRLSDMQYMIAMQFIDTMQFRGDETVLDAGCGSGRITREILKRLPNGKIIGVDLGESMLATARREVLPELGQEAEFIQANLQTFTSKEPADLIFSNMALHFVQDHSVLFQNLANSLKPGGHLALQFGSSAQQRPWVHLLNTGKYGKFLHGVAFDFKGANVPETEQNLRAAGFVDCKVEAVEMEQQPEQLEKMREYFRETILNQCLALLPKDLHDEFMVEMKDMFEKAFDDRFTFIRVQARLPEAQ